MTEPHPLSVLLRERAFHPLVGQFNDDRKMDMPFSAFQLRTIADELDRLWRVAGKFTPNEIIELHRQLNRQSPSPYFSYPQPYTAN